VRRWEIILALKVLLVGTIIGGVVGMLTWDDDDALG
jgi:hypothetical protein